MTNKKEQTNVKDKQQITKEMKNDNSKPVYDLEERNFLLAKECRIFIKSLNHNIGNIEDSKQLVRASGS